MDPNQNNPFSSASKSQSAILDIDTSNTGSSNSQLNLGHQILDQVQLQFIPTNNDNTFISGQIGQQQSRPVATTSNFSNQSGSVIVTGTMEQTRSRDTDFLVMDDSDTQPIDLGSPVHRPDLGRFPTSSDEPQQSTSSPSKYTIWQFDYYARYFDLTTDVLFRRILWSMLPLTGGDKGTYIDRFIQSQPDLYGPFWIPLTLAFTISICDDIIQYFNLNSLPKIVPDVHPNNITTKAPDIIKHHPLAFEFERINMATTLTFSYVILVPLILWSFCLWRRCTKLYSFIECVCAYGYSLSSFIPATILALINIKQIQFILFASSAFLSGSVLLISFAPVVHSDPSRSFKFAYIMLILILIAHIILALFYLYLFL